MAALKQGVGKARFHLRPGSACALLTPGVVKAAFYEKWSSPPGVQAAEVYSVAFSPDGKTMASGSRDNTIHLWDVASGKEIGKLTGHLGSVNSVVISLDGNSIVSGSNDKTIRLWDISIFNLFLKAGRPTPLFYTFSEGAEFFLAMELEGLEYIPQKRHVTLKKYDKKFRPLLNPPAPGQTKFDQILEWAKKQQ